MAMAALEKVASGLGSLHGSAYLNGSGAPDLSQAPTFARNDEKRMQVWGRVLKASGTIPGVQGATFAVSQIPCHKDEDKYGVWLPTTSREQKQHLEAIGATAAFGVFDGHGGPQTATMLGKELVRLVAEEYTKLLESGAPVPERQRSASRASAGSGSGQDSQKSGASKSGGSTPKPAWAEEIMVLSEESSVDFEKLAQVGAKLEESARLTRGSDRSSSRRSQETGWDPLLDVAIVRAFSRADKETKAVCADGAAVVLILIAADEERQDGSTLIKVAWVGDTRATIELVKDSTSTSPLEGDSMTHAAAGNSCASSVSSMEHCYRPTGVFPLSEDHKPSSVEEMERINNPKPRGLGLSYSKFNVEMTMQGLGPMRQKVEMYARELCNNMRSRANSSASLKRTLSQGTFDSDDSSRVSAPGSPSPKLVSQRSYVGHFMDGAGREVGPMRLIKVVPGASGTMRDASAVGIAMTRSIGDRDGPKSCIAIPDIVDARLGRDEACRIIVASDGVWDVFDNEGAHKVAALANGTQRASNDLVLAARAGRHIHHIHPDDITALVLDLHVTTAVRGDILSCSSSAQTLALPDLPSHEEDLHEGPRGDGAGKPRCCCVIA